MYVRLTDYSKLPIGVGVAVYMQPYDGLADPPSQDIQLD